MSDGSPVEQLAAVGLVEESDLNDADKEVINSLTAEEVTGLIGAATKLHLKRPLERDKLLGFPF